MFTIHTYTDTKCEIDIAKTRLNLLMDKKAKLYCKYFPVTSKINDVAVSGNNNDSKMEDYLHELHEVDLGTGMSLEEEIQFQQSNIDTLQSYLDIMSNSLAKLSGIEYQLFYEIVYKGLSISKAVENIAKANDKEVDTIWKNYYRKIKKYVKRLKYPVIIQ